MNILEKLIASTARIKILQVLMKEPNMQVTALMRKVGCKYNELNRNLSLFEKAGVIRDEYKTVRNRKTRIIHLMLENRRTQTLIKIVKILSEADDDDDLEQETRRSFSQKIIQQVNSINKKRSNESTPSVIHRTLSVSIFT